MGFDVTISQIRSYSKAKETLRQAIEYEEKSFFVQGMCLYKIREEGWYKHDYETFEEFCKKEYGRGRDWGYKQIAAYEAVADVADLKVEFIDEDGEGVYTSGIHLIDNERHARELAKLDSETDRANVVAKAAKSAPLVDGKPKITAAALKKAAESNGPPRKKKKVGTIVPTPEVTGKQWCNHQAAQLIQIVKDLDVWKKKHAKGDQRWQQAIEAMDAAHKAFKGLGRAKC